MTEYGLQFYKDTRKEFIETDDIIPRSIKEIYVEDPDESGSLYIPGMKGNKVITLPMAPATESFIGGTGTVHNVWRIGNIIYWEPNDLTYTRLPTVILVIIYT